MLMTSLYEHAKLSAYKNALVAKSVSRNIFVISILQGLTELSLEDYNQFAPTQWPVWQADQAV